MADCSSVFHEPWWLDATAPGKWREISIEDGGRCVARFPFVDRRILSLRLLVSPPLCPRLGPLITLDSPRTESVNRRVDHLVHGLIDQLPPADLFRAVLRPQVASWVPFHQRGFRVDPQLSYVIDDLSDLDRVWSGIAGHTRRVIRRAKEALRVERDTDARRLGVMSTSTFARQGLGLPYPAEVLDRTVQEMSARGCGTVLTALDESDRVHASAICVWDRDRAWYLGGGGDTTLRSSGAGSLLLWELIRESSRHVGQFDFEGSMVPSIGKYFRNFGGRRETCYLVTRTSRRFAPVWALRQARRRAEQNRLGEDVRP